MLHRLLLANAKSIQMVVCPRHSIQGRSESTAKSLPIGAPNCSVEALDIGMLVDTHSEYVDFAWRPGDCYKIGAEVASQGSPITLVNTWLPHFAIPPLREC